MSQADFARHVGAKPQTITKAINAGKIVKHGTGRTGYIDLKEQLTVAYIESGGKSPVKPKPKPKPRTRKIPRTPPVVDSTPTEQEETPSLPPANLDAVEARATQQDLKSLKMEQELLKLQLGNKEKRGELIRRDTVQGFIHSMHEIDQGSWATLGLKISSDVAAVLGIDDDKLVRKVCDKIDKNVRLVSKQVKREMNKYLKKIGAEKIKKEKKG